MSDSEHRHFLPYQRAWLEDPSPMRICQKARQIGMSYTDAYDSVRKVAQKGARLDVWVVSRDELQAKQYLMTCKRWARALNYAAEDLNSRVIQESRALTALVLRFDSGCSIYCLSSNPDAIVGKTGHVKLDEFALHKDQRMLYSVAKPVTQWGGTLTVMSTHRGANTVFNEIIDDIRHRGNTMGWSLHTTTIQDAVDQGLVERINQVTGRQETREEWLSRVRKECIDEESWQQEYCCIPADESSAFISYDMITGCEYRGGERWESDLLDAKCDLYLGVDVARKNDYTVFWVLERVGDVYHTRKVYHMRGKSWSEQEEALYALLKLPQVRRCCIDKSGVGGQFAERARERYGYKVEPIYFTLAVKEQMAFGLRATMEDRALRIPASQDIRADLRAIRKDVTAGGHVRFTADAGPDGHSDRFWALALALHAAKPLSVPMTATLI